MLSRFLFPIIFFLFISPSFCVAQLSGVYTVGGHDNNGTLDFKTIESAFSALEHQGISGPVTLNIRPDTYYVAATLHYIPGANTVNRVIVQSENLDSSSVILMHEGSGSTIELWNNQFTTLQYLTIESEGHNGDYSNHVLSIIEPYEVQVEHCRMVSWNYYGSAVDDHATLNIRLGYEGTRKSCLISDCTIRSDLYGCYVAGSNGALTFTNNKVSNTILHSFSSNGTSEIYLTGNEMSRSVSCTFNYNKLYFIGNTIHGSIHTDGPGPVFQNNIVGDSTEEETSFQDPVLIKDNIIYNTLSLSGGTVTLEGNTINKLDVFAGPLHLRDNEIDDFECLSCSGPDIGRNRFTGKFWMSGEDWNNAAKIVNNSFHGSFELLYNNITVAYNNFNGTSNISIGWWVDVVNNNFDQDFSFEPDTNHLRNYNNYYPAINTSEPHAYHIDPDYVSSSDLHIQNTALHGLDTLFYSVADDMDGDARIGHSSIGADAICFPDTFDAGSNLTITCGDSIMLMPFTNSAASFQWVGYPSLDTFYNSTPVISPVQDQTYVLNASDACGHVFKDSVITIVEPFEVEASIPVYPAPQCGLPVPLSATYLPSYTYHWSPVQFLSDPDNYVTIASSNQLISTYVVEATHSQCGTSVDSISVSLNTSMISDFDVIIYSNQANFINQSTFPAWYLWDFGDGTQSYEFNPYHIYSPSGWYYVTLFASNSCGEADTIGKWINYNSVGINEVLRDVTIDLKVEPNPFHQSAILKAAGFKEQVSTAHVLIFSLLGSTEMNYFTAVNQGSFTIDLDRYIFLRGIHFVKIVADDGSSAHMIFECQ